MPDLKEDLTHRSTADWRAAKLIFCSRFPSRVLFRLHAVVLLGFRSRVAERLKFTLLRASYRNPSLENHLFCWLFKSRVSFFFVLARRPFIFVTLKRKFILTGTEIVLLSLQVAEMILDKMDILLRWEFFFLLSSSKTFNSIRRWRWCGMIRTAAQWPMLWTKHGEACSFDYRSQFKTWSMFLKHFAPRASWISRKLTCNDSDKELIHNWALVEDKSASFSSSHKGI